MMTIQHRQFYCIILVFVIFGCGVKRDQDQFQRDLQAINLAKGEITLCVSEEAQFGKVEFPLSCSEKVRADFNLATALLHSFEYAEAEKVFAKVIDEEPECLMAYWGVAMSNFHPLWAAPTTEELEKGSKTIQLARSLESKSKRESDYLEAVAVIYDDWNKLDHKSRVLKFEMAAEKIFNTYPEDREAAVFYALALRAASDPADKSFAKQRKAGQILNSIFPNQPDHPGVAHYIIHTYDYPELAELALPAARKYASIAASSAHALHMPSHIFTRLGLWNESIQSNINSMSAAKCYAENSGVKGHFDEEVHGLDYLVYAYLQQGRDDMAKEQLEYLRSMDAVFPVSNKVGYSFASVPTRYTLERKSWSDAASLELNAADLAWDDYPWEKSIVSFGRVLGAVHTGNIRAAKQDLASLEENRAKLMEKSRTYEANQVQIQVLASQAWILFYEGNKDEAIRLMTEAAKMEDATDKHPVTPGEVLPARELLADMFMEIKEYTKALEAYEADLQRHAGRFNGLYGAGLAAKNSGNHEKAVKYFQQLLDVAALSDGKRPELVVAKSFLKGNI
jgi:tetratricopeptide (TPR) repeat protein